MLRGVELDELAEIHEAGKLELAQPVAIGVTMTMV